VSTIKLRSTTSRVVSTLGFAGAPHAARASPGDTPEVYLIFAVIIGIAFVAPFSILAYVARRAGANLAASVALVAGTMIVAIYLLTDVGSASVVDAVAWRSMFCLLLAVPFFCLGWFVAGRVGRRR
jgi:hypothetical protein